MTPSHAETREAYDAWHGNLGVDSSSDTPWYRQVKEALARHGGVAGKDVLEIGCGRGGFSLWLGSQKPAARSIVAADFSPRAVELGVEAGRQAGIGGISWEVQDIQKIQHPPASFDVVISCETIEHVPVPPLAIGELERVLRPGGLCLVTHPNYLGTLGVYRVSLRLRGRRYTEEGQPINHPLMSFQVRHWMKKAGLNLEPLTASGFYSIWPGRPPAESRWLARPFAVMRWFGFHPLHIGHKRNAA